MVPINHFFNHICYSCLLIQVRLRSWPIRYQIKVKLLAILILLVQVQLNDAIGRVDVHSARVVIVRAGLLQVLAVQFEVRPYSYNNFDLGLFSG